MEQLQCELESMKAESDNLKSELKVSQIAEQNTANKLVEMKQDYTNHIATILQVGNEEMNYLLYQENTIAALEMNLKTWFLKPASLMWKSLLCGGGNTWFTIDIHRAVQIHWVPDSATTCCQEPACEAKFTLFNRRHHCRR